MASAASSGVDPTQVDQLYKPFPSFAEWSKSTTVDEERWSRHAKSLEELRSLPPETLKRARDIATRAAAVETGAIENLYEVDRGFTYTVAIEAATWQAHAIARSPQFRVLFEAQLKAYDLVLDFATRRTPLAEAFIRELHLEICQGQETYKVMTEIGPQDQALPKGVYKSNPNHVLSANGEAHAYCPVETTPAEMHRLVEELSSPAFEEAHPVQQAAYAHYALVAIHPFADGNGRVARALSSIFTYRGLSSPLVILVEHRAPYFDSLAAADKGVWQPFVTFAFARVIDSIQLVRESVGAAQAPGIASISTDLRRLYVTPAGFTHAQVDNAGVELAKEFQTAISQAVQQGATDVVRGELVSGNIGNAPALPGGYRTNVAGPVQVRLTLSSKAPANAELQLLYTVVVPRQSSKDDDVLLIALHGENQFSAPISGCIPAIGATVHMRLVMFAEKIVGEAYSRLRKAAEKSLRGKGY